MAEQLNSTAPVESDNQSKLNDRPFRVKLRGSVLVLVRLPNRRSLRAAFHQLSTTGGVIHLDKPLDEKLEVELIFHIREATIRSREGGAGVRDGPRREILCPRRVAGEFVGCGHGGIREDERALEGPRPGSRG